MNPRFGLVVKLPLVEGGGAGETEGETAGECEKYPEYLLWLIALLIFIIVLLLYYIYRNKKRKEQNNI